MNEDKPKRVVNSKMTPRSGMCAGIHFVYQFKLDYLRFSQPAVCLPATLFGTASISSISVRQDSDAFYSAFGLKTSEVQARV